ncbi:hypothetical protein [Pseudomonas sp. zfem005]|uniref:hypothetical protein n=1 Tax=Pseudomonas sp. zfem005 TaxID=3078200 RepID=UPI002928BBAB|nr:hypothetical protein [Pseudomonas sp. zfem005]MDU9412912.1 hypothetical protein [Pseudomonas sp. zfem005]
MRHASLSLLFALSLTVALAQAEEALPTVAPNVAVEPRPVENVAAQELAALQQRLAESERQRNELAAQLANGTTAERDTALLARLRQENQRLKLQLKEAQADRSPRLVSDDQMWFAIGGGVALLSLLIGLFARGGRRQPRPWIN